MTDHGFVYSDYQFINRAGEISPKPAVFLEFPLRRGRIFRFLVYFDFIIISSVLARRGCINKVGLFDSSLGAAEDLDWLLRMTMAAARKYYFNALGFRPSMASGLGIFNLILKSYLGAGARNIIKRVREALQIIALKS
jgi:hypothetical protein